jgi:hypothetical protein
VRHPRVLLIVDDTDLRTRYEQVLRSSGFEPISLGSGDGLDHLPKGVVAGCVLGHQHGRVDDACSRLLARAIPVVRIDPHIRHTREHLPFDVVLPAASEPRELITALRHLRPHDIGHA